MTIRFRSFRQIGGLVAATKYVQKAACLSGLVLVFLTPACGPQVAPVLEPEPVPVIPKRQDGRQEIRQDNFQYRPDTVTVIPASESFIITPRASVLPKPESNSFPVVYFPVNEHRVTPLEEIHLIESIKKCGYSGPLAVTGYTDTTGKENQNMTLSQQRADSVTRLLKSKGYCVTSSRGQGSLIGADLASNRRVDIQPAVPTMHNNVQTKCSKEEKKK